MSLTEREILDSWKEISSFLNRSVKTCQRWESEYSLPIYRLDGSPKPSVFAYKDELETWRDKNLRLQKRRVLLPGFPKKSKISKSALTTKEGVVSIPLRGVLFSVLGLFALIVVVVLVWRPWSKTDVSFEKSGKPFVAVMYFKNNTGEKDLDFWRTALSDSLISDLAQSKFLQVLSGDRLYQILSNLGQIEAKSYSSDVLEQVASQGGVSHIIQGNFARAGETFRIDATLHDSVSGEIIGSERVEGEGEASIFSMVDELTRKIKANFLLTPQELSNDIDREAASISTSSPEAYRYYIEAKRLFNERKFRRSIILFEKAVSIDPEFAMAYRDMAFAHQYSGNEVERVKYLEKALALTNRISDRERYYIQTTYYLVQHRDYPRAIEACKKLLELYPDDLWGNSNLGSMYLDIEEWERAVDQFRILVQIDPESVGGYTWLANAYIALGMHQKVQEILDCYLNNYPDVGRVHYDLGRNYILQQKYKPALIELEKAISLDPAIWRARIVKGDIFLFMGNVIDAKREYQQLQKKENFMEKIYAKDRLANLCLLQGNFENSKEHTFQAIELAKSSKVWASYFNLRLAYQHLISGNIAEAITASDKCQIDLYCASCVKCFAYLKMNSVAEAQRVAYELKSTIEKGRSWKEIRYYYLCMGKIELENEDYYKAIQYIENALPLMPGQLQISLVSNHHAMFFEPLALAYYKSGHLEQAKEYFKAIARLTYGRLYYGDIYAKALYLLAKIHERQSSTAAAIDHYEKFLEIWKNADSGLPEVADARKRLQALR